MPASLKNRLSAQKAFANQPPRKTLGYVVYKPPDSIDFQILPKVASTAGEDG
jgi:hypothetical protein